MRREASLTLGSFPRQLNKKPDAPRCVEPPPPRSESAVSAQCQWFQRPPTAPSECPSGAASHAGPRGASLGASSELVTESAKRMTLPLPEYLLAKWSEAHAKVL